MKTDTKKLLQGMKAGLPVAIGYVPIAVAFGLLAKSLAVPNMISVLMSLLIYAGASQFIGVNLLVAGVSFGEIIITTFLLNLRHFLMTGALSQRLTHGVSKPWRALLAFGVTDETFSVSALNQEEALSKHYMLGLNLVAFIAWNCGTWLGLFAADELPETVKGSMGIALYAMFIGLLVPHIKSSKSAFFVSLIAIAVNSGWYVLSKMVGTSAGWGIIIATITGAAAGAAFFDKGEVGE